MSTRSGGRYVIRNGVPVLVERSGRRAATQPAPRDTQQPVKESQHENTQEAVAGSNGE